MNKTIKIPNLKDLQVAVSNPPSGANIFLDGASRALLGNPGEHCQMSYSIHDDGSITIELTSGHKEGPCISFFDKEKDTYRIHFPTNSDFAKQLPKFGKTRCQVVDVNGNNRIVFDLPAIRPDAVPKLRKNVEPSSQVQPISSGIKRLGELLRELNEWMIDPSIDFKGVEFQINYNAPARQNGEQAEWTTVTAHAPIQIKGTIIRRETIG